MTKYWISFRIGQETVGGKTYSDRYHGLTAALTGIRTGYWEETTAFMIIESERAIDNVAAVVKAQIAVANDLVVIRELDSKDARVVGVVADQDIFKLMPYAKKA